MKEWLTRSEIDALLDTKFQPTSANQGGFSKALSEVRGIDQETGRYIYHSAVIREFVKPQGDAPEWDGRPLVSIHKLVRTPKTIMPNTIKRIEEQGYWVYKLSNRYRIASQDGFRRPTRKISALLHRPPAKKHTPKKPQTAKPQATIPAPAPTQGTFPQLEANESAHVKTDSLNVTGMRISQDVTKYIAEIETVTYAEHAVYAESFEAALEAARKVSATGKVRSVREAED